MSQPETLKAAILGSDLVLASLPAEPVQLIHACLALGFDVVVPASWGDEVIAAGVLEQLGDKPAGTTILCSCPHARRRMLSAGSELTPFMVQTIAPPVAAARYLRALHGHVPLHVTYAGSCSGADDAAIDERLTPAQFLEMCSMRGVSVADQPRVFEGHIPVDRRRHFSLPGGVPTPDSVRAIHPGTEILAPDQSGIAFDVAQCIVSGRPAVLDLASAVGCACSGFLGDAAWSGGRDTLAALEPPRSALPVIDSRIEVDLELPGFIPLHQTYEESVPLSVVVGADLTDERSSRYGSNNPSQSDAESLIEEMREAMDSDDRFWQRSMLSRASSEIEISWPDANAPDASDVEDPFTNVSGGQDESLPDVVYHKDPAVRVAAATSPATPVQGGRGTPTGTPALMTPAGPLPRAYLMLKRIRTGSGEHPAISRHSANTAEPVTPQSVTPDNASEPNDPEPDSGARTPQSSQQAADTSGARTNRGPVDAVLDILSRAIRDVVEP